MMPEPTPRMNDSAMLNVYQKSDMYSTASSAEQPLQSHPLEATPRLLLPLEWPAA
jgi:hypothetical protein